MESLNREQKRAAGGGGGVELVIAGAGTGKTKTLISKITAIAGESGLRPENLLILTFSRKAAEEIKERAENEAGLGDSGIFAGTFHSFAYRIIRDYQEMFFEVSDYTAMPALLEEQEKESFILSGIMSDLERFKGMPCRAVYDIVSGKAGGGRLAEKLIIHNLSDEIESIRSGLKRFKFEKNLIEFDDMMHYASKIIRENSDIRYELQNRFRYILVDEFQDTSDDNFELLSLLLPEKDVNFFAVGDDWQSIYGFRNSNIDYILGFRRWFPRSVTHRLTVNYRSRKEIVNISNKFILKNRNRTRKKLVSFRGGGGQVKNFFCSDALDEVRRITLIAEHENSEEIAVLYRNNRQGRFIEKRIDPALLSRLKLMTIHASKGLEFEVVILAGISDSVFPDRSTDLEEERRLMYVALTRARERLYILSHPDEKENPPRFLRELSL